jgi:hypothetical protein
MPRNSRHVSETQLCAATRHLTAPTGNFLRVSAQMRKLDLAKNYQ